MWEPFVLIPVRVCVRLYSDLRLVGASKRLGSLDINVGVFVWMRFAGSDFFGLGGSSAARRLSSTRSPNSNRLLDGRRIDHDVN